MAKHNVWLSVSDLMTGLMVIFLFIAIAYMSKVRQDESILAKYVDTKKELHAKLVNEFAGDTLKWKMSIGKDLSMKFNDPTVLFSSGSYQLTDEFKKILDEFLPKYFDILLNDELKDRIQEVRIEGHTDRAIYYQGDPDPYLGNVILSQRRSFSVLRYFRNMEVYKNYSDEDKELLDFWFTSSGLSYGRALDEDGNYIKESKKEIDPEKSRRVEFRIITNGEDILENFVNKKSNGNR